MDITISEIKVERLSYPLIKPYILSFTILKEFISIQVTIKLSNDKFKIAEVIPLLGYNDESESSILEFINSKKDEIVGLTLKSARKSLQKYISSKPFSVSPLITAIDLFKFKKNSFWKEFNDFVIPVSTENISNLNRIIEETSHCDQTLKIKLSGDPNKDIIAFKTLSKLSFKNKLRLDANQAYSLDSAVNIFNYINQSPIKNNILYVEQPLLVNDWKGHEYLRKNFPKIEIMLDESIVMVEDILNANKIGINYLKLKLFKQGGVFELIKLASLANNIGIKVVLGNGVASSLSNMIEVSLYLKYPKLFMLPLEANGYLKIKK
jgi:O-succinylbenzoate synthase